MSKYIIFERVKEKVKGSCRGCYTENEGYCHFDTSCKDTILKKITLKKLLKQEGK